MVQCQPRLHDCHSHDEDTERDATSQTVDVSSATSRVPGAEVPTASPTVSEATGGVSTVSPASGAGVLTESEVSVAEAEAVVGVEPPRLHIDHFCNFRELVVVVRRGTGQQGE